MWVSFTFSTKFELDRFINNGNLLSDRKKPNWKRRQTHRHTDTDTHTKTHTETEFDTLPIYDKGSSKKRIEESLDRAILMCFVLP